MREIMLVLGRELKERVRTRSFVIGTVLFPVFVLGVMLLPSISRQGKQRQLVVVNEGPDTIAQMFVAALERGVQTPGDTLRALRRRLNRYQAEIMAGPVERVRAALVARIENERIYGYVVIPANVRDSSSVQFRSTRVGDPTVLRDIRVAASEAVHADRLARAGLNLESVAELLRPVDVNEGRVDVRGEEAGTSQASFFFAYIVAMVIYMMIAMYGTGVTRSVLEEKNNRIAEVLVSSMRATHLMAGKILGVGSAVLLQVLTWVLLIGLLITQSDWLAQRFNVDPAALNALTAQPGTSALLIAYFVLGFLLFAALFAGLGAAVTSDQEAQSFQMFLMVPLFVPLLFLLQLTTRPLEPLARMLGLIPFTAPVAMPMRMAAARIPNSEIVASLALLVVTLALTAWLAGKIYRIGILSTGKRPSMAELIRWLRTS
jgi:ABC-2 type transport system permease protein